MNEFAYAINILWIMLLLFIHGVESDNWLKTVTWLPIIDIINVHAFELHCVLGQLIIFMRSFWLCTHWEVSHRLLFFYIWTFSYATKNLISEIFLSITVDVPIIS